MVNGSLPYSDMSMAMLCYVTAEWLFMSVEDGPSANLLLPLARVLYLRRICWFSFELITKAIPL